MGGIGAAKICCATSCFCTARSLPFVQLLSAWPFRLPFFWAFFCPRSQLRSQLYSRAVFAARSLSADARAVSFGSQLGSVRPPCAGLRACFCASRGDGALRELLFG